jgi:hypothetical protein
MPDNSVLHSGGLKVQINETSAKIEKQVFREGRCIHIGCFYEFWFAHNKLESIITKLRIIHSLHWI